MTHLDRAPDCACWPVQREQKHRVVFLPRRLLAATLAIIASNAWSACGVSAQGVNFGSYDPFGRSNLDGAGNIAVTCDLGVTYTIALSSGGGAYAARVMANGAYSLEYNLYSDAARILVWGDGNGGTATVGGSGAGTATNVTIYGRIPAAQNAHVGNYSDNVVVTVTF
jgi:spore coat protein U-like protein